MLPLASLIIPSRNRPGLLGDAVAAVMHGDSLPAELIVVDQSDQPHPGLAELGADRPCPLRYLWRPAVGVSRARNQGISAARYPLLAFVDDDVLIARDWFDAIIAALVDAGPRSVVTGQVRSTEASVPGGFAPSLNTSERAAVYAGRLEADVLYSNNMALPRAAFDTVGGFDVRLGPGGRFSNAEDNDLGFRLLEAGFRIVYEPRAVVYHRAWRTAADRVPLLWSYGRGQGAYYAKHLRRTDGYMLRRLCRHVLRHLARGGRQAGRQPVLAAHEVVYVTGILAGAAQWAAMWKRRGALDVPDPDGW